MKTIGLLGGMSWESSVVYYQLLNRRVRERLGGLHSAKLLLWSFDFAPLEQCLATEDWTRLEAHLVDAARRVEEAGADCLVIATNTMHRFAPAIQAAIDIPLLHIADVTAAAMQAAGVARPLLLATQVTMEGSFYRGRLRDDHGIDALVPSADERLELNRIIFEELCLGVIDPDSKATMMRWVAAAKEQGADGVIFGCTEIGLILEPDELPLPAFDTAELHAAAAIDFALS